MVQVPSEMLDDKITWHPKIVRSYLVSDSIEIKIPNEKPNKYKTSFLQIKKPFLGNAENDNMKCKCKFVKDSILEIPENIKENELIDNNENNNIELEENNLEDEYDNIEGNDNNEIIETLTHQLEENNKIIKSILNKQIQDQNNNYYNQYQQPMMNQYQPVINYQQPPIVNYQPFIPQPQPIPQYQYQAITIPNNINYQNIPSQNNYNLKEENQPKKKNKKHNLKISIKSPFLPIDYALI